MQTCSGHEICAVHALTTLPSKQTHTQHINPVPTSFLSPESPCFSVCFFSLQHILIPCLVCVRSACVSSGLPVQEGNLIPSFFFYLFPNPITQPGWDCPSVNRKGILREIVVGNNKPTCHEDKSIFKASGFSGTTAQKSITSCSFWSRYCI